MTSNIYQLMPFLVLLPFLTALLCPVAFSVFGRLAGWLLALFPGAIFYLLLQFWHDIVVDEGVVGFHQDWVPALGISFSIYLDGLSLTFGLLIAGIGTLITVYAGAYIYGHAHQGRFLSFLFLFMGSMLGVVLSGNLVTMFVFWELTSLTSFLLIGFGHTKSAARRAALQALVVTGLGGLALLAGVILMDRTLGGLEFSHILSQNINDSHAMYLPILLLVLLAAFTKSAQFPFQAWLPNAMEAPTPVSAYLHSATMVKAGIYLLMRLHPILGDTPTWNMLLCGFGGITLLIGALDALRQNDLKLLLASTTIGSLGLLVLLIGISNEMAMRAAALYLVAHALFKGSLFMLAGAIDQQTGTRDLRKLGQLRTFMPLTFVFCLLAAFSMGGLPLTLGFVAKETMYAALDHESWLSLTIIIVLLLGNAMMLAGGFIVAIKPFFSPVSNLTKVPREAGLGLMLGPAILVIGGIFTVLSDVLGLAELSITKLVEAMVAAILLPLGLVLAEPLAELDFYAGLPHAVNFPLMFSIITYSVGLVFFLIADSIRRTETMFFDWLSHGPDRAFDKLVAACLTFGYVFTKSLQNGHLSTYMRVLVFALALVLLLPNIPSTAIDFRSLVTHLEFYEAGIFAIMAIGVLTVVLVARRLTAIIALGVQGSAVALVFLLFGAPDLAFTQFMIETLSVVILALVLTRYRLTRAHSRSWFHVFMDGALALACGIGLSLAIGRVLILPFDERISEFFLQYSRLAAHGRNVVNVIIVDFRGLDTLGEITVVAIAGVAILGLIRIRVGSAKPISQDMERR